MLKNSLRKYCFIFLFFLLSIISGGQSGWIASLFGSDSDSVVVKKTTDLWQLTNRSHTQIMGYILRSPSGKIVLIDGGTHAEAKEILRILKEECGTNHVDYWFLTHLHSDHYGALLELQKHHSELTVGSFYCSLPSVDLIKRLEPKKYPDYLKARDQLLAIPNGIETRKNMIIPVDRSLSIKVLNDWNPDYTNNINDTSICFRVDTGKNSILFTGDLAEKGGDHLFLSQPIDVLRCDYTQMAHHGQSGLNEDQYRKLDPKRCLWPTTDWIWINDGGKGPGTGWMNTAKTIEWMKKLDIKEHYNAKDGLIHLEIE